MFVVLFSGTDITGPRAVFVLEVAGSRWKGDQPSLETAIATIQMSQVHVAVNSLKIGDRVDVMYNKTHEGTPA
jgi:hypothetical protein